MGSPHRQHPLDLRVPPPVVAGAAVLSQWLFTRGAPRPARARTTLAAAFLLAGATIGARGLLHFDDAGTTFHPHHPEATTTLVTTGVYSRTRNPMYVAMAVGLLGTAIYRGRVVAMLPILGFAAYLQRFQIQPEERALRALFGKQYKEYAGRVPRWI